MTVFNKQTADQMFVIIENYALIYFHLKHKVDKNIQGGPKVVWHFAGLSKILEKW